MIKNYKQYITEDLRSKLIYPELDHLTLHRLYPDIQVLLYGNRVVISRQTDPLDLNQRFYQALRDDFISVNDIIFEDCSVMLESIPEFTKISDYGEFGDGIKNFSCLQCRNLKSLQGSPKETIGDFDCQGCKNITSLDGAPEIVGGYFCCSYCYNLTSLQGAPKDVQGTFDCMWCENLQSLDGSPEIVGENFNCSYCNNITTLQGCPRVVGDDFKCLGCSKLISIQDGPEDLDSFYCDTRFYDDALRKYGDKFKQ